MVTLYESFKENKLHIMNIINYEWKEMPFNNIFHNTLVDSEMKNNWCVFVGVANFSYLGKTRNLHWMPYFETKEKEKSWYH
jgi:hypothetical protein